MRRPVIAAALGAGAVAVRLAAAALGAVVALASGGCGLLPASSSQSSHRSTAAVPARSSQAGQSGTAAGQQQAAIARANTRQQQAAIARADRTHEVPTPTRPQSAPGFETPVIAIDVFATGYINWTADTIATRMRALAVLSVGQARSTVTLDAAETAQDYELHRGGVANSGTVEAIAPVLNTTNEFAVVTQERTTAANTTAYAGLQPAWHLALATVTRVRGGGWAVNSWRPES